MHSVMIFQHSGRKGEHPGSRSLLREKKSRPWTASRWRQESFLKAEMPAGEIVFPKAFG